MADPVDDPMAGEGAGEKADEIGRADEADQLGRDRWRTSWMPTIGDNVPSAASMQATPISTGMIGPTDRYKAAPPKGLASRSATLARPGGKRQ